MFCVIRTLASKTIRNVSTVPVYEAAKLRRQLDRANAEIKLCKMDRQRLEEDMTVLKNEHLKMSEDLSRLRDVNQEMINFVDAVSKWKCLDKDEVSGRILAYKMLNSF